MKGFFLLFLTFSSLNAATVAHYKFENSSPNAPLYELTDSSGRSHHGRVLGKELFEITSDIPPYPGLNTTALDLRGRLDYAVIPHHSDFAPTGDWAIEFFFKPSLFHQSHGGATGIAGPGPGREFINTNLAYTILYKQNTNQPTLFGSAWAFHYLPAKGWVVFTISYGADRGEVFLVAGDFRDDKWHHIAVVFAASAEYELRLYQDGFRTQSHNIGNVPFSWGDGPIFVGAWAAQNDTFSIQDRNFDGFLDELRFSNGLLDERTFVVDFSQYLFRPVQPELFSAIELQFTTETNKTYRIEGLDPTTGAYKPIGYALGEGGLKSFFYRRDLLRTSDLRIVPDLTASTNTLPFTIHDAIEIRFLTEPGQLYTVQRCETVNCPGETEDRVFLLGDGAKMSHFERAGAQSRFYRVERY